MFPTMFGKKGAGEDLARVATSPTGNQYKLSFDLSAISDTCYIVSTLD